MKNIVRIQQPKRCAIYFPNTHPQLICIIFVQNYLWSACCNFSSIKYKIAKQKAPGSSFPFGACSLRKLISLNLSITSFTPKTRRFSSFPPHSVAHQAELTHAQHRGKQGKGFAPPTSWHERFASFPSCAFRPEKQFPSSLRLRAGLSSGYWKTMNAPFQDGGGGRREGDERD